METKIANMRGLAALLGKLDAYAIPRHPDIDKAIAAHDFIQKFLTAPRTHEGRILDLDEDQLAEHLTEAAVRTDPRFLGPSATSMQGRLVNEAAHILVHEHLPTILDGLRVPFTKAAKGVFAVAKAGVRPGMDAEDVLALEDISAVKAWRALPEHVRTLDNIAALRIELSEVFGIAPTISHPQAVLGETVDYTACFVHPDSGVTTGWGTQGTVHRWLSLSIATNGRLRLNDPDKVDVILHGEGESPGWIVCGGGAVVKDDAGRDLHLYQHDWIPSWVEADQVDRLLERGLIVAARPEAIRPSDKQPLT